MFIPPSRFFAGLFCAGIACNAGATPTSALPVALEVSLAPAPVKSQGATHLVYELQVTNYSAQAFDLTGLDVLDAHPGEAPLQVLHARDLAALLTNPGAAKDSPGKLGPGSHAVLFIDLRIAPGAVIPTSLHHRLHVTFAKADGSTVAKELDGAQVDISDHKVPVLSAPLRGDAWLAFDSMSAAPASHRRTTMVLNGTPAIAQRFAIDWLKLGKDGKAYRGAPQSNESWYGYGAEVLAVADGVVAGVHDGIPDNAGSAGLAAPATADKIAGNSISLDIGDGRYVTYAHLQPGSLRVKRGEPVRAGDVIALLGNSGNSDAPHLHFQITNTNSVLGAEGVPYVFDSYQAAGTIRRPEQLFEQGGAWRRPGGGKLAPTRGEIPANNAVVIFP